MKQQLNVLGFLNGNAQQMLEELFEEEEIIRQAMEKLEQNK